MPNAEKVERVARLRERIEGSTALLLADFRGLSVTDVMELRRSLDEVETRFSIVKNTLMKLAAEESGVDSLSDLLQGPTAVGFVEGDAVAAAKRIVDAAKRFPALELKGAWVEGRLLGSAEAQTLATLESREAMLSKVAGLAKAEMSRAASMFQTMQSRFLGLLEAYGEKLPGETQETAEPEAAPATPESEAAPQAAEPEAPAPGKTEPEAEPSAETEMSGAPNEEEPAPPDGEE